MRRGERRGTGGVREGKGPKGGGTQTEADICHKED